LIILGYNQENPNNKKVLLHLIGTQNYIFFYEDS